MTSEPTPAEQYRILTSNAAKAKKKRGKYNNTPVEKDGVRYDSQAELSYKAILDYRVRLGEITGYDFHIKFPLLAQNGDLVGYYEADYVLHMPDGSQQVHDVKSPATITSLFKWKAKHFKAQYGTEIITINSVTFKPILSTKKRKPTKP